MWPNEHDLNIVGLCKEQRRLINFRFSGEHFFVQNCIFKRGIVTFNYIVCRANERRLVKKQRIVADIKTGLFVNKFCVIF